MVCHLFSRSRTTVHPRGDPRADKVHASPPLSSGKRPPLSVSTLMYAKVGIVRRDLEKENSHIHSNYTVLCNLESVTSTTFFGYCDR